MSKASVSYYDWEQTFKKKQSISDNFINSKSEDINSLGLLDDDFKNFLKKWKEKNLSQ